MFAGYKLILMYFVFSNKSAVWHDKLLFSERNLKKICKKKNPLNNISDVQMMSKVCVNCVKGGWMTNMTRSNLNDLFFWM